MDLWSISAVLNALDAGRCMAMKKKQSRSFAAIRNAPMSFARDGPRARALKNSLSSQNNQIKSERGKKHE